MYTCALWIAWNGNRSAEPEREKETVESSRAMDRLYIVGGSSIAKRKRSSVMRSCSRSVVESCEGTCGSDGVDDWHSQLIRVGRRKHRIWIRLNRSSRPREETIGRVNKYTQMAEFGGIGDGEEAR